MTRRQQCLRYLGITAMFGRVAYGKLADSIGGLNAYLTGSIIQTCMVFWFTQIDSINGLYAMSVAFGLGYSGVMTSIAVSLRELTPVHRRGVSWGIVALFGWFEWARRLLRRNTARPNTKLYRAVWGCGRRWRHQRNDRPWPDLHLKEPR